MIPSAIRFKPIKSISSKNVFPKDPVRNAANDAMVTPYLKTRFGPLLSAAPPDIDMTILETR
jgi:hypothetical protein